MLPRVNANREKKAQPFKIRKSLNFTHQMKETVQRKGGPPHQAVQEDKVHGLDIIINSESTRSSKRRDRQSFFRLFDTLLRREKQVMCPKLRVPLPARNHDHLYTSLAQSLRY